MPDFKRKLLAEMELHRKVIPGQWMVLEILGRDCTIYSFFSMDDIKAI